MSSENGQWQGGRMSSGEDPVEVGRYIEAPVAWSEIRVQQLLDHSDGLPDIVRQPDVGERMLHRTTLAATVDSLRGLPLGRGRRAAAALHAQEDVAVALVTPELIARERSR